MAIKGSATITLTQYRDTQSVTRYYKLQPAGSSAPSKPDTKPPSSDWSDSEPACDISKELYFCDLTIFSNGEGEYSKVSKSTSYEAAKEAYNKANDASTAADNAQTSADNAQATADEVAEVTDGKLDISDYDSDKEVLDSTIGDINTEIDGIHTTTDNLSKEISNELVAKGYAKITNEPSLELGRNASDWKVKITNESVDLQKSGISGAKLSPNPERENETLFRTDTTRLSNLYFRSANGQGKLGIVAQSNGHVSLKEI